MDMVTWQLFNFKTGLDKPPFQLGYVINYLFPILSETMLVKVVCWAMSLAGMMFLCVSNKTASKHVGLISGLISLFSLETNVW